MAYETTIKVSRRFKRLLKMAKGDMTYQEFIVNHLPNTILGNYID